MLIIKKIIKTFGFIVGALQAEWTIYCIWGEWYLFKIFWL